MAESTGEKASDDAPVRWDQVHQTSPVTGPSTARSFWSADVNTGFRLSLCLQGIVAIPAGWKTSFAIGVAAQTHGVGFGGLKAKEQRALVTVTDGGDPRWIRFPLDDLARVTCKRDRFGLWRHRILVERRDGTVTRFGVLVRSDFALTCKALAALYGDRVVMA
jgi:hypothetical protein